MTSAEKLAENSVIYGAECQRRVQHERPGLQTYQLDFLCKILPNYQKIEKTNVQKGLLGTGGSGKS